ncbi:hypothetical protein DM785_02405 [Deinococcus actinosclerus]|nr:hypothetical protein DM785_02405 [Deinococcus actinosclerus]
MSVASPRNPTWPFDLPRARRLMADRQVDDGAMVRLLGAQDVSATVARNVLKGRTSGVTQGVLWAFAAVLGVGARELVLSPRDVRYTRTKSASVPRGNSQNDDDLPRQRKVKGTIRNRKQQKTQVL